MAFFRYFTSHLFLHHFLSLAVAGVLGKPSLRDVLLHERLASPPPCTAAMNVQKHKKKKKKMYQVLITSEARFEFLTKPKTKWVNIQPRVPDLIKMICFYHSGGTHTNA